MREWVFFLGAVIGAHSLATSAANEVLEFHAKEIQPLEYQVGVAWWNANVSGKDADFKIKEDAQNAYDAKLADPKLFKKIKGALAGLPKGADAQLRRQLEIFYLIVSEKQVSPELLQKISAKSNAIEKTFNTFRAKVGTREFTDSEVKKVLKESTNSQERQAVWEASKAVGAAVEKDLKELVTLRNLAAKQLGYRNYHAMQLQLSEQDPKEILALFDQLDALTRKPFLELKTAIDKTLAANSGVAIGELRPWHYHDPFFQEAPSVFDVDLDKDYAKLDISALTQAFYKGIGLPVDDILARSDLYEKKGKSPHAFCTDIDRKGDVRVLANIVANEAWMSTMLHEFGHAVYSSKFIPQSLPYLLRSEAHILTTEGVAMLFQKFSKSADWLKGMGVAVANPKAFNQAGQKLQQAELLVFSRWAQVMFRFEKSLYENPEQDLNALWWRLVEKYQGLKVPGRALPDYASKIHIVVAPAYYHNYLMGQLFASQVHHTVAREVLGGANPRTAQYLGNPKVGEFFRTKIFGPGKTLKWNELTRFATGEPLNAKAFAQDLAN